MMGKLGNFYYPDIDAKEAVDITRHIYNFPSHTMSVQMLAEKLNISARGGWTGMILASLKNFGLVEGRGTLRTTPLAEKIINPIDDNELMTAKLELFNKIELWRLIRADYEDRALSSEFTGYLIEKVSADRIKVQKRSKKIAKLYTNSVAFCFSPTTRIEEGRREKRIQDQTIDKPLAEISTMSPENSVSYGSSEDFGIWVKKDIKSINFLESQIEAIKAWLEHQKSKISD